MPGPDELAERLDAARTVIGLIFTEGHHASGEGPPIRAELCEEAIWLGRQLHQLSRDDETTGLVALMLLHHARAASRQDLAGRLILFDDQDRDRWDRDLIAEARALLAKTGRSRPGRFQLQAAIALVHVHHEPTPWHHIAGLLRVLLEHDPSPVVALQHAVAVGRATTPEAGLRHIELLRSDVNLEQGAPLHAARADLLERAGDTQGARAAWHRAAGNCRNAAHRQALLARIPADRGVLNSTPRASNS